MGSDVIPFFQFLNFFCHICFKETTFYFFWFFWVVEEGELLEDEWKGFTDCCCCCEQFGLLFPLASLMWVHWISSFASCLVGLHTFKSCDLYCLNELPVCAWRWSIIAIAHFHINYGSMWWSVLESLLLFNVGHNEAKLCCWFFVSETHRHCQHHLLVPSTSSTMPLVLLFGSKMRSSQNVWLCAMVGNECFFCGPVYSKATKGPLCASL